MKRNLAVCLNCEYEWFPRHEYKTETLPWRQCHKCLSNTVLVVSEYKKDFQHLQKIVSSEEAKKFIELYDYAVQQGYISARKGRDVKFRHLLKDLKNSSMSLGV
jgi:hypothetical protein